MAWWWWLARSGEGIEEGTADGGSADEAEESPVVGARRGEKGEG